MTHRLHVNHSELYHSKGNLSPGVRLPERTADAVGCEGPADCSGGWACRWAEPGE